MKTLIIVLVVVVLAILLALAVRIVRQYEQGVLFRPGRLCGSRAPGLRLIIPFIDVLDKISLRIVTMPIQSQGIITRGNVGVDVSAVAYYRVVDAVKSVLAIEVLRMRTVLIAADRELHQPPALSPDVLPRLRRSLQVVRTELTRSVSGSLATELRDLLPPQPASASMDELRVECAGLLGWTGGLVMAILDQVQLAAAVTAPAAGATERS